MAKKKLIRFEAMKAFDNVLEPDLLSVLDTDHPLKGNWNSKVFKNNNKIILELGCGKGEYSVGLAEQYPDTNFIGVDIKGARIWYGATDAAEKELNNVFFLRTRIDFIDRFFALNEIAEIWITFPDPQPQKNRARKRLTSKVFIERYKKFLVRSGTVNLKTDSDFMFEFTLDEIAKHNYNVQTRIDNVYESFDLQSVELQKILKIKTHYETIFSKKGSTIKYVSFNVSAI